MYAVQNRFGNQWVVVDTHGQMMCIGTMRQCEDWLDCRDNLPAQVPRPAAMRLWHLQDELALMAPGQCETSMTTVQAFAGRADLGAGS